MQKMKQMWILRWMYEADVVPKSMFSIVLDYLNGIEGQARQVRTLILTLVRIVPCRSWMFMLCVAFPACVVFLQRVLDGAHEIIDAGVPGKTGATEEDEEDLPTRLARRRYKRALQVAERLA